MNFADFIAELEARTGLSRRQIEKRAGYSAGALFIQLKRGGWPPVERLQKLAAGCGVVLHLAIDGEIVDAGISGP